MAGKTIDIKSKAGDGFTGYLALPESGKGPGRRFLASTRISAKWLTSMRQQATWLWRPMLFGGRNRTWSSVTQQKMFRKVCN